MSTVVDEVRTQIEGALAEYRRFRNTGFWSMHEKPVRQALEAVQRELRRLQGIHDAWCRETSHLHVPRPSPMDAEIRLVLRTMSSNEREGILREASSAELIGAVLNGPHYLSGMTIEQQRQFQQDVLKRLHGAEWEEQASEGKALKELQGTCAVALRNLTEESA